MFPASTSTRITFVGHSTVLLDLGGVRLLTDPLLRDRLLILIRRHRGLAATDLGSIDGVLVSHLHHDHLDPASLQQLGAPVPIVGPPGASGFLAGRGLGEVTELRPGEETTLAGINVRAIEARHAGGRMFRRDEGTAVGYLINGPIRIYFAGDTALFDGMADLGPLDLALLPIWGWGPKLGPGHLDPETAAQALQLLRPRFAMPIHWGSLAPVGGLRLWPWLFARPLRQFVSAADRLAPDVEVCVLEPGETMSMDGGELAV